jgi:hypothetical protein
MPGYVIGLLLFAAAVATFAVLLRNSLRMTPDEQERPVKRRRVLLAASVPTALVAAGVLILAWLY